MVGMMKKEKTKFNHLSAYLNIDIESVKDWGMLLSMLEKSPVYKLLSDNDKNIIKEIYEANGTT